MFEIGFSELCMIALVSLLVIGPERLPRVARIAGYWLGKTRSMVANVKAEIHDELLAEDLRQTLSQQSGLHEVREMLEETSEATKAIKSTFEQLGHDDGVELLTKHEKE